MKKGVKNKVLRLIILVGIIAIVGGSPVAANAATKPVVNYNEKAQFMLSPEWKTFGMFCVEKMAKNATVSVTVDKPKIATAKWDKSQKIAYITAQKPGTVNVTFKIKQGGKTYTYKSKMTWVKYTNPLKSLKIGSTSYKVSYFDGNTQAGMKKVSGKNAVKVTLKKGYQLTGLAISRGGTYTTIKNGEKINFTKSGGVNTVLFINYKDSKGNNGTLRLFVNNKNEAM